MLKGWNKRRDVFRSFHLETITLRVLDGITISSFPSGVRYVFDKARDKIKVKVADPAGYSDDVGAHVNTQAAMDEIIKRLASRTTFLRMANVPLHQNEQRQLQPLRAARTVYNRAKVFLGVQIVLTVLLPVAGAFAALSNPSLRAFVALGALVIAILDASVLDRAQKRATRRAARV
jgi:hypothetical protein